MNQLEMSSQYERGLQLIRELCAQYNIKIPEELVHAEELVSQQKLQIGVLGRIKTGKTTLINCLLGKDILPRGVRPTTAAITTIKYEHVLELSYESLSGELGRDEFSASKIHGLVVGESDIPNPIVKVNISYPHILGENTIIIDTPGLDDIDEWRAQRSITYLQNVDLLLLVIKNPLTASLINILEENVFSVFRKKTFFCLTFADAFSEGDIRKIKKSISDELYNKFNERFSIYAISPLKVLGKISEGEEISDSDWHSLIQDIQEFLQSEVRVKYAYKSALAMIYNSLLYCKGNLESKVYLVDQSEEELDILTTSLQKYSYQVNTNLINIGEVLEAKTVLFRENVDQLLIKLKESVVQDLNFEIDSFTGKELDKLTKGIVPRTIKQSLLRWERENKSFLERNFKELEMAFRKELKGVQNCVPQTLKGLLRIKPMNIMEYTADYLNTPEIREVQVSDKLANTSLLIGGGSVLVALMTGQFVIALLPLFADRLFGISNKRAMNEKVRLKPELLNSARITVDQFRDRIHTDIDEFRLSIIERNQKVMGIVQDELLRNIAEAKSAKMEQQRLHREKEDKVVHRLTGLDKFIQELEVTLKSE